ncbi:bifunctional diguanylate cyclase/phosphodiesterase [Pacificimonas sp. ICDLI1SI03]
MALLICGFGSVISLSVGRRGIQSQGPQRRYRLYLAGLSTGLTVWATHFSAMLAYTPGVQVRFNAPVMLGSACLAVLMATCAWFILSVDGRRRGVLGGAFIGLALSAAHFIDMSALRVDGIIFYDPVLIAVAIGLGFPFCVFSGMLARNRNPQSLPWAAVCLIAGTATLHMVAMSSVGIIPTGQTNFTNLDLGFDGLTFLVIVTSALILAVGAGLALHDLEVARATAVDRERLFKSQEHHRYSVELSPQIPWIADANGRIIEISPRWSEVVGEPAENANDIGWANKVHPDDLPTVLSVWKAAILSGDADKADVRYRLRQADESYRWFRARARPRRDEHGEIVLWYGSLEDIHEQVNAELALRASEERYRLASLATNDVIWDVRANCEVIEWAGAVEDVLGYPEMRSGTDRKWWINRVHPEDRPGVLAELESILHSGANSWTQEFRFWAKDGRYVCLLSRGHVVRDEDQKPLRMVGSLMDITTRKRGEDELRWAAHHDPLTHLPNRKLFSIKLDAALEKATKTGGKVGLIVVDVDGFKTINDTLGHAAGDATLKEVAALLSDGTGPNTTIARLGGDEFALIISDLAEVDKESGALGQILKGTSKHITYDGQEIEISLSMGAAVFPADGQGSESLLKSADLALYAAKAEGTGNTRRFTPSMRETAEREKRMRINARDALLGEQLIPYYQPKICLRTGRIVGFEALLRWRCPKRGIQPPSSIQAAFEDPRLAPELTDRMLTQISSDMAIWLDQGQEFGRIAMNGSPEDFRRGDLANRILDGLGITKVPPDLFELEITETVFLGKHVEEVGSALRALRKEGVTIALDDFGTGYASLTHLKQFPIDVLKIDRTFVSRLISDDKRDAAIVGALIDLAKNLGIQTVAEGIETPLQAFMLRRRGCDIGQGYFFARPLPGPEVSHFVSEWKPERVLSDWRFNPAITKR